MSRFSRLTGVLLTIGAIFGLLFSLGGLFALWSTKDSAVREVNEVAALVGRTLDATDRTLAVVNDSLEQASDDLEMVRRILVDVGDTLDESNGLVVSTSTMIGTEMVNFVDETQDALSSVQTSARLIDDTLRIISAVPFVGQRYRPEIPLQESVAEVSRSLDPLPTSFARIQRELEVSAANIATVQAEVDQLAEKIADVDASLERAREVSVEYREIFDELRSRYDAIERRLPLAMNLFYIGMTGLLAWALFTQAGMLAMGIEVLRGPDRYQI